MRRGWGTYVFAAQPQRALSLSAPHLFDDAETELEAVEAFLTLGTRTLLIAGTDRDQNTAKAPCQQSSRPFLEADVSHTAESVFQMAFEEIYSSDVSTWHLQFHGNANPTLACKDIDVFLSNGVQATPTDPSFAPLYALAANIVQESRDKAPAGPVLMIDVYDAGGLRPSRDGQHADEVRLGSAAREHLRGRQRPNRTFAAHSRGAAPRCSARLPDGP
jgi:hypothetical protein